MYNHNFVAGQRLQRFPLTLTNEAILLYQAIHPFQCSLEELQEIFSNHFSKVDNTREQLFHAWISFHFNENADIIDAFVQRMRQVAALLNYGELQILKVYKNTLPSLFNWVLFPIKNLGQAVETVKRTLTKEMLDRQLAGHSTGSSPLLTIKEKNEQRHNRVVFNKSSAVGAKIDKLTSMIETLSTHNRQAKAFKSRVYQGRG